MTFNIFTELANTMMYGEVSNITLFLLYNFVFAGLPFKTVSGDVTEFQEIYVGLYSHSPGGSYRYYICHPRGNVFR